jgi:hypothetical protein
MKPSRAALALADSILKINWHHHSSPGREHLATMIDKSNRGLVRRLADDWENEAKTYVKIVNDRNSEVAYAIRWCKKELLKAFSRPY